MRHVCQNERHCLKLSRTSCIFSCCMSTCVGRLETMARVKTLLIDNYDSYTYNLYQLLAKVNGGVCQLLLFEELGDMWCWYPFKGPELIFFAVEPIVILNDAFDIKTIDQIIKEERIDNIVISPGPGTPCCPKDAGINLSIFEAYRHVPILGVCFGFQTLCYVHGKASVVKAPEPVHGRISIVHHSGDTLFQGIPSGQDFEVVRYHSLCIDETTLDDCIVPLAWCKSTGHHAVAVAQEDTRDRDSMFFKSDVRSEARVLMAARHSEYPHYGVQFHPESIATKYGYQLLDNFRRITLECVPRFASDVRNGLTSPSIEGDHCVDKIEPTSRTLHVCFKKLKIHFDHISGGISNVVQKLFASGANNNTENLFWLDSASKERTRFSYVGGTGGDLWRRISYHLNEEGTSGTLHTWYSDGVPSKSLECNSLFDWINQETTEFSEFDDTFQSFPFEFWGGLVGYIGYELKCQTGGSKSYCSPNADACFFVVDRYLTIDHHTEDVYIVAIHGSDENAAKASSKWVDETTDTINKIIQENRDAQHLSTESVANQACFQERHSQSQYVTKVGQCLSYLHTGDSYELCLTNMLSSDRYVDPWSFYKSLRKNNPAPYSAFLDFSPCLSGPTICCSSPERFLRGTMEGSLEAKPIKGTARRNLMDHDEDAKIAQKLYESEKDRAENLMIVDLLRNDLGKVSETGSVNVPGLMQIETFATVHQMVSTITSEKKRSLGVGDVVKACFPGGSMTGAPKVRSMEILDTLEEGPRGIYSGSLGFFSWNQAFDLNIVIRTAIFNEEKILIGAGGAIVVQSEPLDEYEEMKVKFQTLSSGGIQST